MVAADSNPNQQYRETGRKRGGEDKKSNPPPRAPKAILMKSGIVFGEKLENGGVEARSTKGGHSSLAQKCS